MVWIAAGIMVVLLFCVGLTFALAVLPLQKATNAYNMAVSEYNVHADAYNALIGTTSVANLDGFPSSALVYKLRYSLNDSFGGMLLE